MGTHNLSIMKFLCTLFTKCYHKTHRAAVCACELSKRYFLFCFIEMLRYTRTL